MFYVSIPVEDIAVLTAAAFDKKYGIKVKVWRADLEGFLQRIVSEAKAKRYEVDVIAGSSSALEPLHTEKLLTEGQVALTADFFRSGDRLRRTGNGLRFISTPSSRPTTPIW